jgi:hypothetical protein
MGTAENIQESLERVHAYQHIRKALKDDIPLLKASAIKLVQDINQTKLAVSAAKTAVDEYNSNARSAAASVAAGDAGVDAADLAEGLVTPNALQDAHDTLDATHKSEVLKLEVLTTRHETLLSELSLWEGKLRKVKRRIEKRNK